jgi:hypothetical protein
MFASGFFVKQPKASCVEGDFEALLVRMRQRRYPETIPVLASYWLRTVYASGYGRRHWKKLNRLLKRALGEHLPDAPRQAIVDIQTWIQQSALPTRRPARVEVVIDQQGVPFSVKSATSLCPIISSRP